MLYYHKLLLFWGWGIFADISIIFGRLMRSWYNYLAVHYFIFFVLDVLTITFAVLIMIEN